MNFLRHELMHHGVSGPKMRGTLWIAGGIALGLTAAPAFAAELQPRTVAAFDRYVRVAEARMEGGTPFLWIDGLADADRRSKLEDLRQGRVVFDRLAVRDAGKPIDIPAGLVHHWIGAVFVPGVGINQAVALMQDYDRHADIFRPAIARSKLIDRNGDVFRVFIRFRMKKVITVVVNTDNEARFGRPGADRVQSRIYSLRVAEVEHPGTPDEREKPVGQDGGFLWRLYTYWHYLERDGGTYVQCEAISLTRSIPIAFRWLIGPFVTSIPRESLAFTLETTRTALMGGGPSRE
jgi:hypothetical protein